MKVDEVFNKVFVINLPHRVDKWDDTVAELEKHGIENYERFDAIRPSVEETQSLYVNYSVVSDWTKNLYRGVLGCRRSHIEVAKIARDRGYKNYLVLEDDVKFDDNFTELFDKYMTQLDAESVEWSLLYLGANHQRKGWKVTENVCKDLEALTTGSFAVDASMFDYYIEKGEATDDEIDTCLIKDIQRKFKESVLAVTPNLITQRVTMCDISGNIADYDLKDC